MVTIEREGMPTITLGAWKDETGVHYCETGAGGQIRTLTSDVVYEFIPSSPIMDVQPLAT